MRRSKKPYRDGRVFVMRDMCATCIFRPGNLMHLEPRRVAEMVAKAKKNESAIICHDTIGGMQAVCHGFFRLHATAPLQIADRLGLVLFVDPNSI